MASNRHPFVSMVGIQRPVDFKFDCVKYLAKSDSEPHMVKYGGHPNSDGCRVWGEALFCCTVGLADSGNYD